MPKGLLASAINFQWTKELQHSGWQSMVKGLFIHAELARCSPEPLANLEQSAQLRQFLVFGPRVLKVPEAAKPLWRVTGKKWKGHQRTSVASSQEGKAERRSRRRQYWLRPVSKTRLNLQCWLRPVSPSLGSAGEHEFEITTA